MRNTKEQRKLSIWNTNVDQYTTLKHLELNSLLEDSDRYPDIIAMSEVRAKNNRHEWNSAEFQLDGFNMETRVDKGRGLVMYIKEGLPYNLVNNDSLSQVEEVQMIAIELKDKRKLLIGSIYRSPNSPEENNNKINELLRKTSTEGYDHIVIMGDFNYKNVDWNLYASHGSVIDGDHRFAEAVKDSFLNQHVREHTRGRGTDKPSLIDLVLTDVSTTPERLEHGAPLGKSDHCILQVTFDLEITAPSISKQQYIYSKGNYNELRKQLDIDWESHLAEARNVEEAWEIFRSKLTRAQERCIPRTKPGKHRRKHAIPLEVSARRKINRKKRLWKTYTKTHRPADYNNYCRARNQVRKLTRNNQKQYERHLATQVSTNPKKFWRYANQKTKMKEAVPNLSISGDPKDQKFTETPEEKVAVLAEFFSSVFTREPPGTWELPTNIHPTCQEDADLSINKIEELLADLDIAKSPGPDGIHPRILKEARAQLARPLSKIFQMSLAEGKLPTEWKQAHITPIFKKGDKRLAGNYRPVSLTPIIAKIMEKSIRDALLAHMRQHKLLSKRQYGFISGRSTLLQLLTVLEKWTDELDKGNIVDVIFLDFKKAFDKVPHTRLICKLRHYGFSGSILLWIESFLQGRTQRVVYQQTHSDWREVKSGVPQGSVLGPILFIIYVNSLPNQVEHSDVFLFADDTKVFKSILQPSDRDKLQDDLEKMNEWTKESLLVFNAEKCVSMTIGRRGDNEGIYHIERAELKKIRSEKDLGVTIDNRLTFETHMWEKIKKANSIMATIRRTYQHLDKNTFTLLYKALVRPHLEYCNQAWHPHLRKHIDAIENVQRRATRLIPGMSDLSYPERLEALDLPTLAYRRLRGDMIETFKILTERYDNEVCGDLLRPNLRQSRGHNLKLYKPQARTDIKKFSFTHRIVEPWNSLPAHVIEAPSTKAFEARLDRHWNDLPLKKDHRMRNPTLSQ
jgi:endonuclease/exonuclease/phosphatase family metal-dependent hydrolase